MIKTFWSQSVAAQYIVDNNLPIDSIVQGARGYNCVDDRRVGGKVTAASHDGCKGVKMSLNNRYRRVA